MPAASSAPGAGLRKPTKKVRRSTGRTAGERSVSRTYKSLPKPKRSKTRYQPFYKSNIRNYGMAQGANPFFPPSERAFALDQAIYKFRERADMKPDSRKLLNEELDRLMQKLVETSPNFAKKIKKADAKVAWWKPVESDSAWGTYNPKRNQVRIDDVPTEMIARFGRRNPQAIDNLRKILIHELAHSTQYKNEKPIKSELFPPKTLKQGPATAKNKKRYFNRWNRWYRTHGQPDEAQAELLARKAMKRAYGTPGYLTYQEYINKFKQLQLGE